MHKRSIIETRGLRPPDPCQLNLDTHCYAQVDTVAIGMKEGCEDAVRVRRRQVVLRGESATRPIKTWRSSNVVARGQAASGLLSGDNARQTDRGESTTKTPKDAHQRHGGRQPQTPSPASDSWTHTGHRGAKEPCTVHRPSGSRGRRTAVGPPWRWSRGQVQPPQ
jgi:hypothetical protein